MDAGSRRQAVRWLGPIFVAILVGAIISPAVFAPNSEPAQRALTDEFNSLALPPNTQLTTVDMTPKRGRVLLLSRYTSSLSYDDLKSFYGSQLQDRGWHMVHNDKVTDWGRDLGGRQVDYCKGPYEATLQYAGRKSRYGFDYAFSMTWNLGKLCS